jgi:hypothetical protein
VLCPVTHHKYLFFHLVGTNLEFHQYLTSY